MLAIAIDLDGSEPVYRQIAEGIRRLIAQGELPAGAELPSVRQLGGWIGVNQNTVAKAYRGLAEEGLVELRQGASAKVLGGGHSPAPELDPESKRRLQDVLSRWVLKGVDRRTVEAWLREVVKDFYEGSAL